MTQLVKLTKDVQDQQRRMPKAVPNLEQVISVKRYRNYDDAGTKELIQGVIERSFDKKVVPGFFDEKPIAVIIAKEGQTVLGVAIVKRIEVDGTEYAYLDKIGAIPESKGKRIGTRIMEEIRANFKSLCWRATNENPANSWYEKISEVKRKFEKWTVYSYGLEAPNEKLYESIATMTPSLIK